MCICMCSGSGESVHTSRVSLVVGLPLILVPTMREFFSSCDVQTPSLKSLRKRLQSEIGRFCAHALFSLSPEILYWYYHNRRIHVSNGIALLGYLRAVYLR